MAKTIQQMIREADQHGFSIGDPIRLDSFEQELLGNALFVDSAQPLLHFVNADNFLKLLANRALWFRRIDDFQDKYEGKLPAANRTTFSNFTTKVMRQLGMKATDVALRQRLIDDPVRMMTYVHCWYGSPAESEEMWNRFGGGGKGVCIETSAGRLQAAIQPSPDLAIQLHKVTYSGERTPVPAEISFLAACRKADRPEFVSEKELRLVAQMSLAQWPQGKPINESPDSRLVPVDFGRLFKAVFLGSRMDAMTADKIECSANMAAGSRVVRKSAVACRATAPNSSQP